MRAQLVARGLVVATTCLAVCALTVAQPAGRNEWLLLPQLARGQEFTYSGWFTEERINGGVRSQRAYRLESTLLVLGGNPGAKKWDVAFLTVLSRRSHLPGQPAGAPPAAPSSVRLEVAEVDGQGRIHGPAGAALAVPLEGPPTAECGAVVEVPRRFVRPKETTWLTAEPGRPTHVWEVAGTEVVNSTLCVKLVGRQQSDDWERPRADRDAWRRSDTVWVSPQQGIACKVERVLERRGAARLGTTYRAVTEYEREGQANYPGTVFENCAREVEQAVKFQKEAEPLLRQPALYRPQIDGLLRRIGLHLQQPMTVGPYRKAVLQVQRRIEAALRGEVTPEAAAEEGGPVINRALPGQRVPDFIVTDLVNHQTVQLYRQLGKPVVLLFYNPTTEIGQKVLRFGQQLSEKFRGQATVLGLTASEDEEFVRKQHQEMSLSFPVLDGRGLLLTYGVSETPRLVVIDSEGILCGGYTGWGAHTPREVGEEVRRCLPKERP
jgi:peroxiredoxin